MADPRDEELVALAESGDPVAFGVLVSRHKRMVFNIAWRMLRNRQDAEDAAQEAFLRAFRSLSTFRGQARFSSWLYRIATNVCLSALQSPCANRAFLDLEETPASEALDVADSGPGPQEIADRQDLSQRVLELVGALPPKYRAVLTLYYLREQSYEEVADILGVPLGTVKTHLYRAKGLLRERILEHYDREEL